MQYKATNVRDQRIPSTQELIERLSPPLAEHAEMYADGRCTTSELLGFVQDHGNGNDHFIVGILTVLDESCHVI